MKNSSRSLTDTRSGHRRPYISLGLVLITIGGIGAAFIPPVTLFPLFVAVALFIALGLALYVTVMDGLAIDVTPDEEQGQVQGGMVVAGVGVGDDGGDLRPYHYRLRLADHLLGSGPFCLVAAAYPALHARTGPTPGEANLQLGSIAGLVAAGNRPFRTVCHHLFHRHLWSQRHHYFIC